MGAYRFFLVKVDGGYSGRLEVSCDSDLDALRMARQLNYSHGIDVWEGSRKIGAIEPALKD